jgi:hypothetical protein
MLGFVSRIFKTKNFLVYKDNWAVLPSSIPLSKLTYISCNYECWSVLSLMSILQTKLKIMSPMTMNQEQKFRTPHRNVGDAKTRKSQSFASKSRRMHGVTVVTRM